MHPWHGEEVEVVRRHGADGVQIERANGERQVVPESWTSLVPRVRCELADGGIARVGPETALELARFVTDRLHRADGR